MMPQRIQLRRTKGWRMPEGAVKVDRTTPFGNPWTVPGDFGKPEYAVRRFRASLESTSPPHPESYMGLLRAALPTLKGKDLACWCRPGQPCHADVLLELANRP